MVEHNAAIMVVAFGMWGLIFVVLPLVLRFTGKGRARS